VVVLAVDLIRLNEIIDKLAQNRVLENYKELKDFYEYLADKYKFDSNTHTITLLLAK
jgi:glucosamine 6-phosphate synthetase-like amidotransferase/phosphosugar isomerase protein